MVAAVSSFIFNRAVLPALSAVGASASVTTAAALATNVAVRGAAFLAVGALIRGLSPKPDVPEPQIPLRQSTPEAKSAFGRVRGGVAYLLYEEVDGDSVDVGALHYGRIGGIDQLYLHDDPVSTGSGALGAGYVLGDSETGQYFDAIYVDTRDGVAGQSAFHRASTMVPGNVWTSGHRGEGCALIELVCLGPKKERVAKVYPRGLPVPSALYRAQYVYDWTNPAHDINDWTTWSGGDENPIRQLVTFMINPRDPDPAMPGRCLGMGEDFNETFANNLSRLTAAAQVCDQQVAKKGGGTEPRYTCNFEYFVGEDPADTIQRFLDACDGWMGEDGAGGLVIDAGAFSAPTVTVELDWITGYDIVRGEPDEARKNVIQGFWTDPDNLYARVEADRWFDATNIALTGKQRVLPAEFPQVHSHGQVRRLVKRVASRLTAPARGTLICDLNALKCLGERYLRLPAEFTEADELAGAAIEVDGFEIDLENDRVVIGFILADETIDAWDPDSEEGLAPPVGGGADLQPVPVIDSADITASVTTREVFGGDRSAHAQLVFDAPVKTYDLGAGVLLDSPRDDLTWVVRWRKSASSDAWEEALIDGDVLSGDQVAGYEVTLTTPSLPRLALDVQVAAIGLAGTRGDWSDVIAVDVNAATAPQLSVAQNVTATAAIEATAQGVRRPALSVAFDPITDPQAQMVVIATKSPGAAESTFAQIDMVEPRMGAKKSWNVPVGETVDVGVRVWAKWREPSEWVVVADVVIPDELGASNVGGLDRDAIESADAAIAQAAADAQTAADAAQGGVDALVTTYGTTASAAASAVAAEQARDQAQAAQGLAEQAQQSAETAFANSDAARALSEGARDAALIARDAAELAVSGVVNPGFEDGSDGDTSIPAGWEYEELIAGSAGTPGYSADDLGPDHGSTLSWGNSDTDAGYWELRKRFHVEADASVEVRVHVGKQSFSPGTYLAPGQGQVFASEDDSIIIADFYDQAGALLETQYSTTWSMQRYAENPNSSIFTAGYLEGSFLAPAGATEMLVRLRAIDASNTIEAQEYIPTDVSGRHAVALFDDFTISSDKSLVDLSMGGDVALAAARASLTSEQAASAAATAASNSASAANADRVLAETARSGAETAETNSAQSATDAAGSQASAANAAVAAANSETSAGNSATAAASSASSAASSATAAGNSAAAADASALTAQSAFGEALATAQHLLPERAIDPAYWTKTEPQYRSPETASDVGVAHVDPTYGDCLRRGGTTNATFAPKAVVRHDPEALYEITITYFVYDNGAQGYVDSRLGLYSWDQTETVADDNVQLGGVVDAVSDGLITRTLVVGGSNRTLAEVDIRLASNASVWRPHLRQNWTSVPQTDGQLALVSMEIRDVTARVEAEQAQAAAESARDSAVTAQTGAETAQSAALSSATDAANSATAAGGSAAAASGSASSAATQAGAASTSASAAQTAQVAAETARDDAQAAESGANNSASAAAASSAGAATSASDAQTQAAAAAADALQTSALKLQTRRDLMAMGALSPRVIMTTDYVIDVIAFEDDTQVFLNGVLRATLSAGGTHSVATNEQAAGDLLSADKPIHAYQRDGGDELPALIQAGTELGFRSTRYYPIELEVYSPYADARVKITMDSTDFSAPLYDITVGRGQVVTQSHSEATDVTRVWRIQASAPVVVFHHGASSQDGHAIWPVAPQIMMGRGDDIYPFGGETSWTKSGNPAVGLAADEATRLFGAAQGDGNGSDCEGHRPLESLGDVYLMAATVHGYRLVAAEDVEVEIRTVAGVLKASHSLSGSLTAPATVLAGSESGNGAALAALGWADGPFIVTGTGPFLLRTNDPLGGEEYTPFGYRSSLRQAFNPGLATAAGHYAQASASSAASASSSATDAASEATAAQQERIAAETAQANAAGSASAAASSESAAASHSTDAGNSAAAAAASAVTAQTAQDGAVDITRDLLPARATDPAYWTNNEGSTHNPDTAPNRGVAATDPSLGDYLAYGTTANWAIGPKGLVPHDPDAIYEVTYTFFVIDDGAEGYVWARLGLYAWNQSGVVQNDNLQYGPADEQVSIADGVVTKTLLVGGANTVLADSNLRLAGAATKWRPHLRQNQTSTPQTNGEFGLLSLAIRDVTARVAAENQATAAATSASNAAASETAAGTSATASASSETNAATSASSAGTSATQASAAASDAQGHAAAAQASETNAATSETNASASAASAATSSSQAATSATAASNSASTASSDAASASASAASASGDAAVALASSSLAARRAAGVAYSWYGNADGAADWTVQNGAVTDGSASAIVTCTTFADDSTGSTSQTRLTVPKEVAAAISGKKVKVRIECQNATPSSSEIAVAFSTNSVGNSGWQTFTPGARQWFEFEYDVPDAGSVYVDHFIGVCSDTSGAGGAIEVFKIELVEWEEGARVDVHELALADGTGDYAAFRRRTVAGGSETFFEMVATDAAGNENADVGIGGRRVVIYNPVADEWEEVIVFENGVARAKNLQVGLINLDSGVLPAKQIATPFTDGLLWNGNNSGDPNTTAHFKTITQSIPKIAVSEGDTIELDYQYLLTAAYDSFSWFTFKDKIEFTLWFDDDTWAAYIPDVPEVPHQYGATNSTGGGPGGSAPTPYRSIRKHQVVAEGAPFVQAGKTLVEVEAKLIISPDPQQGGSQCVWADVSGWQTKVKTALKYVEINSSLSIFRSQ